MIEDKDEAGRIPANDTGDAAVSEFPDEGAETTSPEERVAALEQELAEAKDRMLRALADGENTRRRAQREREDTLKYAVSNFARDLLSPVDNLRRALDSVKEAVLRSSVRRPETRSSGMSFSRAGYRAVCARRNCGSVMSSFSVSKTTSTRRPTLASV